MAVLETQKLEKGTACWVVYVWQRFQVGIVGVYSSEAEAEAGRQQFIDEAEDPEWEKASGSRRNNTLIEMQISK